MLPLVEFPQSVQHYAPWFEAVFSAEALVQFQRYLSGLIVSENKTIDGINRLFVIESRNQSSLNRLLTASPFSEAALNGQRLALLNSLEGTRVKAKGVLSVDDTLLRHYGRHFDEIAFLYDPTEKRYTWAHNLVNLHYSDEQSAVLPPGDAEHQHDYGRRHSIEPQPDTHSINSPVSAKCPKWLVPNCRPKSSSVVP
jgi:hypothetical protein